MTRAAKAVEDHSPFLSQDGDWAEVKGDLEDWEGNSRWVDCITRGDVFGDTPGGACGLVGAELIYYMGPYMLEDFRADDSHFAACAQVVDKLFQSDDDESICYGPQLASEIGVGLKNTALCCCTRLPATTPLLMALIGVGCASPICATGWGTTRRGRSRTQT